MSCPCPEGNVNIQLEIQTKPQKKTCLCPGGPGHAGRRAGKSAEFALATDRFLAPLICRVVRAVRVLGAGLGFPVGEPSVFTPNLRSMPHCKCEAREEQNKRERFERHIHYLLGRTRVPIQTMNPTQRPHFNDRTAAGIRRGIP